MKTGISFALILFFGLSSTTFGQNEEKPNDVESIDHIITALYEVISGPAGQRDWDRMQSLFKPGATMGAVNQTEEGEMRYVTMTPEEYKQRNDEYFRNNDFWEEEIDRKVFEFGEMATVQTSYEILNDKDGEASQRGVNSVQLVYDQDRWWITSITWNTERDDNPIPQELLKDSQ